MSYESDSDSERLRNYIRDNALKNIKQLTHVEDAKVVDMASVENIHPDWTALIQLSGPQFRMSFRLHFATGEAKVFAGGAFGMTAAEVSDDEAKDFMAECTNICTGRIKRLLSKNDIMVGMSLPMVSPGLGELESTGTRPFRMTDQWTIASAGGALYCSTTIEAAHEFELLDPESLSEEDIQVNVP